MITEYVDQIPQAVIPAPRRGDDFDSPPGCPGSRHLLGGKHRRCSLGLFSKLPLIAVRIECGSTLDQPHSVFEFFKTEEEICIKEPGLLS